MDDGSMPVPADPPVSVRTRASLAAAAMLSGAAGAACGTTAVPPDKDAPKVRTRVHFEDEWDGEYDAETDEHASAQPERVFFDDEDDDGDPGDDDDMQQRDGESSDEYEASINDKIPSLMHFCCRPAFS